MNNILYFMLGLSTCSVAWRIDAGKFDDIVYPCVLLLLTIVSILSRMNDETIH